MPEKEELVEEEQVIEAQEEVKEVIKPGKERKPWLPKTKLGNRVLKGEYATIDDVLRTGELILEAGIVDYLVPDLKEEIIYIGGSPGKGGGSRRTATKRTARMHKSGRRFKLTALIVVGNENGVIGIGKASSREHRIALEKASEQSKINLIRVRRGCGSWECGCGGEHSVPFKSEGKYGSVHVRLIPAPKGVGIVANDTTKKILTLAGIKDIWVKTRGQTSTRQNLAYAVFDALKNLNTTKGEM
ncbi:MAG: 30S ribosomal protein S5 [Candidatus Aenigmarchaeota archaeon]|nr:30S ribosomal protein S5 [Candidatus Aenigmarchaeota archaeon]